MIEKLPITIGELCLGAKGDHCIEIIEAGNNRSYDEIRDIVDLAKQSIRLYISRKIAAFGKEYSNNGESGMEVVPDDGIAIGCKEAINISELLLPRITRIFEVESFGYIYCQIENEQAVEIDYMDIDDLMEVVEFFHNYKQTIW